jgi:hypothetical protein
VGEPRQPVKNGKKMRGCLTSGQKVWADHKLISGNGQSPEIFLICGQLDAHSGSLSWQLGNMGFLQLGKCGLCYLVKMHLASNSSQFLTNFNQNTKIAMWTWQVGKVELEARKNELGKIPKHARI